MTEAEIAVRRLVSHRLASEQLKTPAEAAAWMGALQAQDYGASLRATGVRVLGATEATIEAALDSGEVVRTWPMRGTLHLMAPNDVRWMLELTAPRAIQKAAGRARELEVDGETVTQGRRVLERVLAGSAQLTRAEVLAQMASGGIATDGQRGMHLLSRLAQEGAVCVGPRRGKEPTFVLVDEWIAPAVSKTREEGLQEIATRYFRSHGPATVHDLAWWTGLTVSDCREAVELAKDKLEADVFGGRTYLSGPATPSGRSPRVWLLAGFDEYVIGYGDRDPVLERAFAERVVPGKNGVFLATVIVDGVVAGTWRKKVTRGELVVTMDWFGDGPGVVREEVDRAVREYGAFVGMAARLSD